MKRPQQTSRQTSFLPFPPVPSFLGLVKDTKCMHTVYKCLHDIREPGAAAWVIYKVIPTRT